MMKFVVIICALLLGRTVPATLIYQDGNVAEFKTPDGEVWTCFTTGWISYPEKEFQLVIENGEVIDFFYDLS